MPEKKTKLKPQHQIVIEERAKGKSQTDAYLKAYPKVKSRKVAQVNASRLLSNAIISDAAQKRIELALANAKVTPEEVVGSAVRQMRSSIRDVLDDNGSYDFKRANETGAIDMVKKHKETVKTSYDPETNQTQTTTVVEIEMLTNQDGRKEVANYIGVENFSENKPQDLTDEEMFVVLFNRIVAKGKLTPEETVRGLKRQEKFAHLDETKLLDV